MDVREKLVELLNEVQETGVNEIPAGFGCTREYVTNEKVASHLISNGVTVQEWISVKDRFPEKQDTSADGFVLCYTAENKHIIARHSDVRMFASFIPYWMPLPPAPKGE